MTIAGRIARARGLDLVSLVAVNGAGGFWEAQGFARREPKGGHAAIASYGEDALYMERQA